MGQRTTKPTKWHVRPSKTQISLGIRQVWSESSLSAWRKLRSLATHWVHSEDSDQTVRMPRLIWVITKTCLYNFDPLIPHFYIIKLGFTGVYIIFLISARKHRLWVQRGSSNKYPQCMFWAEIWKISVFHLKIFSFLEVKFTIYLYRRVFVMIRWALKPFFRFCHALAQFIMWLHQYTAHTISD